MRMLALVLLGLLGLASPSFAENIYIGQASAGFGDGTSCDSQRAISFFNGAGNWGAGANLISPGDTVYLCGTITTALTVQGNGTAGSPITISPAPAQTTTINATGLTGPIFNFSGHQYIILDGVSGDKVAGDTNYRLVFTNLASTGSTNTFAIYENSGGDHIAVKHIKAIFTGSASLDDNGGGVFIKSISGVGIEVAYCWVTGTSAPNKHAQGVTAFSGAGNGTSFTSFAIIHHNQVEYMYHDGIRTDSNTSVYNNYIKEIGGSGHSDGIICQSGNYCQVYNNTMDNGAEIYLDNILNATKGPIRVYNNVSYNHDGYGGFGVEIIAEGGGSSVWNDVVIANNTFWGEVGSGIRGSGGSFTNMVILNNIFGAPTGGYQHITGAGGATFSYAGSAFDYNAYGIGGTFPNIYNVGGSILTLTALQSLSFPRETHGLMGSPKFAGTYDYHLASDDTVARGNGVNLTATHNFLITDKDGTPRSSSGAWDLGAYAGASASTQNPPPSPPVNLRVQ